MRPGNSTRNRRRDREQAIDSMNGDFAWRFSNRPWTRGGSAGARPGPERHRRMVRPADCGDHRDDPGHQDDDGGYG
jgi:hypothetical protein